MDEDCEETITTTYQRQGAFGSIVNIGKDSNALCLFYLAIFFFKK